MSNTQDKIAAPIIEPFLSPVGLDGEKVNFSHGTKVIMKRGVAIMWPKPNQTYEEFWADEDRRVYFQDFSEQEGFLMERNKIENPDQYENWNLYQGTEPKFFVFSPTGENKILAREKYE